MPLCRAPLLQAMERNNPRIFRMLLEAGARITFVGDMRNIFQCLPSVLARYMIDELSSFKLVEFIEILVDCYEDIVNEPMQVGNQVYYLLHHVAFYDNFKLAELLLQNGAIVDVVTYVGDCTPLHLAVLLNHTEMTRLLLKHGADPNALWDGDVDMERVLLSDHDLMDCDISRMKAVQKTRYNREIFSEMLNILSACGFKHCLLSYDFPYGWFSPGKDDLVLSVVNEQTNRADDPPIYEKFNQQSFAKLDLVHYAAVQLRKQLLVASNGRSIIPRVESLVEQGLLPQLLVARLLLQWK
ncbi:unnamed protein product [Owenia fusiformis]|uniref:Uncharacterized protein n=1 Tax=Owenia fusiformis TaxID=6347 RepID=A0A8S4Q7C8_OWEFU|nr:unnamed protein product [Owenia fusiformis]